MERARPSVEQTNFQVMSLAELQDIVYGAHDSGYPRVAPHEVREALANGHRIVRNFGPISTQTEQG